MAKRREGKKELREPKKQEFEQQLLDLARVTRVTAGGKRLRFRACLVIGDKAGRVGLGVAKGSDVANAVEKAVRQANKNIISVPIINETIRHWVKVKYGPAEVLLRPAQKGAGVKAGGATRVVLKLAGVPNITAKMLGSKNKINNARATIKALQLLKSEIRISKSETNPNDQNLK